MSNIKTIYRDKSYEINVPTIVLTAICRHFVWDTDEYLNVFMLRLQDGFPVNFRRIRLSANRLVSGFNSSESGAFQRYHGMRKEI